ncbi:MAG: oxalurate catabolism protein HpxZ [Pseudomonadota bacterium]
MEINRPEILAEVEAAFAQYETALVNNDIAKLNALFHDDQRTIRYGVAENLYGYDEIAAFRRSRRTDQSSRTLSRTVITTFGDSFATAMTLFDLPPGEPGRQSQTWVRFPSGWQIVAAHVSRARSVP